MLSERDDALSFQPHENVPRCGVPTMNRRAFLATALAAIPAAKLSVHANTAEPKKYGLMTVDRCIRLRLSGIDLSVFLDGEDVSNRCREADDECGYTLLYRHNEKGEAY